MNPKPTVALTARALGLTGLLICVTACGQKAGDATGGKTSSSSGKATAGKKAVPEGEVLATVGDQTITREMFEKRLNQQSPFARNRLNSDERKKEFLDNLVRFELLAFEAERKGYGENPDVVLARKQAMVKQLMAEEVRDLVKVGDITDEEIKTYYDEHIEDFDKPAQVRAAHVLLKDEAQARKLLGEIKEAVANDKLKARDIFARYVREHSADDATRQSGGDLQFFGKPGESRVPRGPLQPLVPPPVAIAAYDLADVGDVAAEPIKSSQGWHLIQKTGFKRRFKRDLKDVTTSIRNKLFRSRKSKALEDYVANLRKEAKVTVNEDVLGRVKATNKRANGPGIAPPLMKNPPPGLKLDPSNPPPAPGLVKVPGQSGDQLQKLETLRKPIDLKAIRARQQGAARLNTGAAGAKGTGGTGAKGTGGTGAKGTGGRGGSKGQ